MRIIRSLMVVAALTLAAGAQAAEAPKVSKNELATWLDSYLAPFIERNTFSGVVLVAEGPEVTFSKAYGMANVEFAVPNRLDTRFAIASINKLFTAVALTRLEEMKKLSGTDPLSKWVPNFPEADKITIAMLRRHRSGIRDPEDFRRRIRASYTTEEVVAHLATKPLGSVPGAQYSYTTANYAVLAHIIERVTGKLYADAIRELVYAPAGMRDAGDLTTTTVVPRLANGYMPDPFSGALSVCGMEDPSWKAGGGSTYATAADLHHFIRAFYGGKLLESTDPSTVFGETKVREKRALRLSGSFPGASAQMLHLIEEDRTIIVLSNNYAGVPGEIVSGIDARLAGETVAIPSIKLATNASAPDARILGNYLLENIPFPLSIEVRHGKMIANWNPVRQGALLRTGDDTWFSPFDWATLRFKFDETGRAVSGEWISTGRPPLKITRVEGSPAQ